MSAFQEFNSLSLVERLNACNARIKDEDFAPSSLLRRNTIGLRYRHEMLIHNESSHRVAPLQWRPKPVRTGLSGVSSYLNHNEVSTSNESDNPIGRSHFAFVGNEPHRSSGASGSSGKLLGSGQFASVFGAVDLYETHTSGLGPAQRYAIKVCGYFEP